MADHQAQGRVGRGRSRGRSRASEAQGGPQQQHQIPGPAYQADPPRGGPGGQPWGNQGGHSRPPPQSAWGPPPGQQQYQQPQQQMQSGPPQQSAWGPGPSSQQQAAYQVRGSAPQGAPAMQTGRATFRCGGGEKPGGDYQVSGRIAGTGDDNGNGGHSARGGIRGRRHLDEPLLKTRPEHVTNNKKGTSGHVIKLMSNYFRVINRPDWNVFQYRVDFAPEIDRTIDKKRIMKEVTKSNIPVYMFDGTVLYVIQRLHPDPLDLFLEFNNEKVKISIRLVGDLQSGDHAFIQFFNIILRKCMDNLKLQLVGRDFYDAVSKVPMDNWKLELWPGYVTSIRQHEKEFLVSCEIKHKVMRMDTVANLLYECMQANVRDYRAQFSKSVIGLVVLTDYNNKTYRIDDVDWKANPQSTFEMKDKSKKCYVDYYCERYKIKIGDMQQPLLVSRARARDLRAGMTDTIYLIPELCRLTGLTDAQRNNFRLMKDLALHTRVNPQNRIQKLIAFAKRVRSVEQNQKDLREWDLNISDTLVELSGRVLAPEIIVQGPNASIKYQSDQNADWTKNLRDKPFLTYGRMDSCTIVGLQQTMGDARSFWQLIKTAADGVRWQLPNPRFESIRDDRNASYLDALEKIMNDKSPPSMIICIVPNQKIERYSAIKKKLCVDKPVHSQIIQAKNLNSKGAMSIATKIMIQMNCKLGGAPWTVEIPLKGVMVIGFDVTHDTNNKSQSYGAMVASLDTNCTRYYANVSPHKNGEELSDQFTAHVMTACKKYHEINKMYPSFIIVYRDGVGDGQIQYVKHHEVLPTEKKLKESFYKDQPLKFVFCIVSKRINTRFFSQAGNPPPGTVVDDVVTLPERYDFYIVSQCVREGTVSPTSYNVIHDTAGLPPDRFQRLTYKFTHTYYNWSGTVRVPAPCQYAHKLAFLMGQALHRTPSSYLENTLYFL